MIFVFMPILNYYSSIRLSVITRARTRKNEIANTRRTQSEAAGYLKIVAGFGKIVAVFAQTPPPHSPLFTLHFSLFTYHFSLFTFHFCRVRQVSVKSFLRVRAKDDREGDLYNSLNS